MAYISGNISTFQSRLHQLPTGLSELSGGAACYLLEGQSYSNYAPVALKYTWNKEFALKYYQLTKTGIPYSGNYLQSPFPETPPPVLTDLGAGHTITWVTNYPIGYNLMFFETGGNGLAPWSGSLALPSADGRTSIFSGIYVRSRFTDNGTQFTDYSNVVFATP